MQTTIALSQIHYQNTSFKNKQLEDPPTHLRSGLSSFFLGDVIYLDYFFVAMRNVMISLAVEIIRYFVVFFCFFLTITLLLKEFNYSSLFLLYPQNDV